MGICVRLGSDDKMRAIDAPLVWIVFHKPNASATIPCKSLMSKEANHSRPAIWCGSRTWEDIARGDICAVVALVENVALCTSRN